jgi:hypothetical protein
MSSLIIQQKVYMARWNLHLEKTPLYTATDSYLNCLCHPPSSSRVAPPRAAPEADCLTQVSLLYRVSPWPPPPPPAAVVAPLPFEAGGN